ncbi:MAG: hypothetical protein IJ943_09690 [Akkermansia sp.]|nr:hypothetical protein [Akkermansia sp.]
MKSNTIMALALAAGAAHLSQAADFDLGAHMKDAFKVFDAKRDNAENPYLQELTLKMRGQYQWGYLAPAGDADRVKGNRKDNNEWRRFRLGAQAKALNMFTLKGIWNIGGLDARNKFSDGVWERSQTKGTLDELTISTTLEPVTLTLGKHKPAYMAEYRTSSAKLITLERSMLVNQLKAEKLYGISVASADKKADWSWNAGLWVNGQRDNTWLEPALNGNDSVTLGMSVSRATGKNSRLQLDYMHSFHKDGETNSGSEYAGPGAQDVVALSWEAKKDKLSFLAESLAGFNVYGGDKGAENVFGLVLMPSYRFSPHWEGVVRYQLASGNNAVKCDSRYYTTNSTYSGTSDKLQGLYVGANYYVSPTDPHMMKLMVGAEYLNSDGCDVNGNKGFTGWQFSSALRFDF